LHDCIALSIIRFSEIYTSLFSIFPFSHILLASLSIFLISSPLQPASSHPHPSNTVSSTNKPPSRYNLIAARTSYNGFDRQYLSDARLIDASSTPTATATFELTITEYYSNLNNVMHGGAAGVIFDMSTTCALGPLARPGFWE
jgi:hypothetical protein